MIVLINFDYGLIVYDIGVRKMEFSIPFVSETRDFHFQFLTPEGRSTPYAARVRRPPPLLRVNFRIFKKVFSHLKTVVF